MPATDRLPPPQDLFQLVLNALRELGGSARPPEVAALIASTLGLSDEALDRTTKNGTSLFSNRVNWARLYLAKTGYIDSSQRGVWTLTDRGQTATVTSELATAIRREVQREVVAKRRDSVDDTSGDDDDLPASDHRSELTQLLLSIPPAGFERLCQRLLRESGFEEVEVTGRSGDGGIDGQGVLSLNPFVSFKILFQCKRYKEAVGAPAVRDFRGAMMGRADKGLVLTTGRFTQDARREAAREGVPPIELVDGDKLIDLFESLELGLVPKQAFEVDSRFFDDFRSAETRAS